MLNIKEVILFPLLRPKPFEPIFFSDYELKLRAEYIAWIKAGKPGLKGRTAKEIIIHDKFYNKCMDIVSIKIQTEYVNGKHCISLRMVFDGKEYGTFSRCLNDKKQILIQTQHMISEADKIFQGIISEKICT